MDFASLTSLRRRLAFRPADGSGEVVTEEVMTSRDVSRAIEDGRVQEDRMVLPQIEDQVAPVERIGATWGSPRSGDRVARPQGSSARRSQSRKPKQIEDTGERKRELEPRPSEVATKTPERFSMATPDPSRESQGPSVSREEKTVRETLEGPRGVPQSYTPLVFDPREVQKFEEMQRMSPLLSTVRSEERILQSMRPEFLEEERKKKDQDDLMRSVEELARENSFLKSMMQDVEKVMMENEEMKKRIQEKNVEIENEEERPRYRTPEEPTPRRHQFQEKPAQKERPFEQNSGDTTVQVMLTLMQGMQEMQRKMIDREEKGEGEMRGVEFVRGQHELPKLPEWHPGTAPIDLNDWLVLIEPVMADLTQTSQEWWEMLLLEAKKWYDAHVSKTPLERLAHEPEPSKELSQKKWSRLEKRASTMLMMGIPESQREEMVATKQTSAMKIVCRLLTIYQPGGLAEKEVILRALESPTEAGGLVEAVGGLRKWMRWRNRAKELGVSEPDASILLRGLGRVIKKPLEANRELSFRVNLTRSMLQVDSTPNSTNVHQFATHVLAEMELLAHAEGGRRVNRDQPRSQELKLKKFEREGEDKGAKREPNAREGKEQMPCRFFNTDTGCRKGKECRWAHAVEDGRRRCWICGAVDHFAGACTRPKDQRTGGESKGAGKGETSRSVQKAEIESKGGSENALKEEAPNPTATEESGDVMKGLLEEATKMLKVIHGAKKEEPSDREVKLQQLQRQIDDLKSLKVFRIASLGESSRHGLLDSGATHALRGRVTGEKVMDLPEVRVSLACGRETFLRMTEGGTMVAANPATEPIVPLGKLIKKLNCKLGWDERGLVVVHPKKGRLEVYEKEGCPHISREVALDLIQELEETEEVRLKSMETDMEAKEEKWIRDLIEAHPVLQSLPGEVRERLRVRPSKDLRGLPGVNRRKRKRILREGGVVHLYAGPDEGYTLGRALKEVGGDRSTMVEIDILRGEGHDMTLEEPYASLTRMALDGKMRALVGGPNCRTRSVLRHYYIQGGPRPVRSWGDGEFGNQDLTEEEKAQVQEDDTLMWRMILLFIIAEEVNKIQDPRLSGGGRKTWFGMEQPAFPHYKPEVVSIWRTKQWARLCDLYGFEEVTFNQGDWGGDAVKPTTWGGSLMIGLPERRSMDVKSRKDGEKRDSKTLARWAPGMMREVAKSLQEKVRVKKVVFQKLSWQEHVLHGHIPFRKDCRICQEASAKKAPHRRVVGAAGGKTRAGVLSIDTTGPLVVGEDVDGAKVRFLLVGAFTWLVPKESKLKDDLPEDEEDLEDVVEIEEILGGEDEGVNIFSEEEHDEEEQEGKKKRGRGRPRKEDRREEEDRMSKEEMKALRERAEEEKKKDDEDGKGPPEDGDEGPRDDFEIRVFRMLTPMRTKSGEEVLRAVAEMVTRLHLEGFNVTQIHTDHGGEFSSRSLQRWIMQRGIARTFTGVDDPQSNGRAENSVQTVKSYIRRALRHAGFEARRWPLAARHVSEMLRFQRLAKKKDFPPLGAEVLVKKRRWDAQQMDPTMEKVIYIAPSPWNYGHWVRREDGTVVVSRFYIAYTKLPVEEGAWIALENHGRDPMEVRRRIRGKSTVQRMQLLEMEAEESEDELVEERTTNPRITRMIEEEMKAVAGEEDLRNLKVTLEVVAKLRKMVDENPEEEVLQTKIVGMSDILANQEEWKKVIQAELTSLLEDKEALRPLQGSQKEEFFGKAQREGRKIEIVPGKLVSTIKPGPGQGKKKARIVACGNFTNRDAQEDLYASTGDAVVLRLMLKVAAEERWQGVSLDVKTAFLNTPWDDMDVLVRPPNIVVRLGLVSEGTLWQPTKALYGFRRSPRLWGNHRDSILIKKKIEVEGRRYGLQPLVSEPNLWRIQVEKEGEDGMEEERPAALMMVYVDDIFVTGEMKVLEGLVQEIQKEWNTSEPEWVSTKPLRFLGMEIRRMKIEEEQNEGWAWTATQTNYTRDLLKRNLGEKEEMWHRRKVPMSRDPPPEPDQKPTLEMVREAQRISGELLWLVTRTRPDLMYTVSRISAMVLHNPQWVKEAAWQVWGFLVGTMNEGVVYRPEKGHQPWEEGGGLEAFADASFSPGGEESHGSVVISLRGGPLVWRSSRQATVTLSTAEAELNELIEGLMLGESVAAVVEELEPQLTKVMVSDSQAAVNIVQAEGGSWRTRHLRLRAAHAKQRFTKGDWILQHRAGEVMVADIGTKPLTSTRLNQLKEMIGMAKIEDGKEDGEGEAPEKKEKKEDGGEKGRGGQEVEVEAMLRMVLIMAMIQGVKGQGGADDNGERGDWMTNTVWVVGLLALWGLVSILRWLWEIMGWWLRRRIQEPEEEPRDEDEERRQNRVRRRASPYDTWNPSPAEGQDAYQPLTPPRPSSATRDHRVFRTPPSRTSQHSAAGQSGRSDVETPVARVDSQRRYAPSSSSRPPSGATGSGQSSQEHVWSQVPPFPIHQGEHPGPGHWVYEVQVGNGGSEIFHPPEVPPEEIYPGKGVPFMFLKGKGKGDPAIDLEDEEEMSKGKGKGKQTESGAVSVSSSKSGKGSQSAQQNQFVQPDGNQPGDGGNAPRNVVYITRFGAKFHLGAGCPSLHNTRGIQRSLWCPECSTNDQRPVRVYAQGPGSVVHEDPNCPRAQARRMMYGRCGLCG